MNSDFFAMCIVYTSSTEPLILCLDSAVVTLLPSMPQLEFMLMLTLPCTL